MRGADPVQLVLPLEPVLDDPLLPLLPPLDPPPPLLPPLPAPPGELLPPPPPLPPLLPLDPPELRAPTGCDGASRGVFSKRFCELTSGPSLMAEPATFHSSVETGSMSVADSSIVAVWRELALFMTCHLSTRTHISASAPSRWLRKVAVFGSSLPDLCTWSLITLSSESRCFDAGRSSMRTRSAEIHS